MSYSDDEKERLGVMAGTGTLGAIIGGAIAGPFGIAFGGILGSSIGGGAMIAKREFKNSRAKCQGYRVYGQYGKQKDDDRSKNYNMSDTIIKVTTRKCNIGPEWCSFLADVGTTLVTTGKYKDLTHWYTVIETSKGHYYQLQFRGGCNLIELRKCDSFYQCDEQGLFEAQKAPNAPSWTEKPYTYKPNSYSIGDVVSWMRSHDFSAKYFLTEHNCQDLCKAFYYKF